jgi:two-component system, OmpR family, phosphate regulon sensor histidine kinase PhoR
MQEELTARVAALERGRERLDTLIESMVEAVLATNASGGAVTHQHAARQLIGYGPDDRLPNVRELFVNLEARNLVDQVMQGQVVLGREIALEGRTVLVTARPLPAGGAVVCLHDITEVKRLESIRRDFVANVSHELKTPLTSIAGYAETLLGERPEANTERRFLEVIFANAKRMQRLVDDLLDLARLESGGWIPRRETFDAVEAGRTAWAPFADRAAERGVAFEVTGPVSQPVSADPEALRQILSNLFDNALRYTPAGGRITLDISGAREAVQIAVRDTGSGIPAEHVPRVFERFYRVDRARSRDQGGTGLGLSIVKHLVDAHGGRVDLESALGHGTTVRVTLPTQAPS